ncbi:MAG: 30S ribosomal protein S19 [Candidatus Woesebacteria bacterium]|nr:MAG: 30S ribosomal protein S19 [Candidatus Woesebacteria bacterium]
MSRSSKKGPFIDPILVKKVESGKGEKETPIKTWSRKCRIAPTFIGKYFQVHNGHVFIDVFITEDMVGHALGEFAPTRTFRGHGEIVKRTLEKT